MLAVMDWENEILVSKEKNLFFFVDAAGGVVVVAVVVGQQLQLMPPVRKDQNSTLTA